MRIFYSFFIFHLFILLLHFVLFRITFSKVNILGYIFDISWTQLSIIFCISRKTFIGITTYHIETPVLIRSVRVNTGHYLDGWPLENAKCCKIGNAYGLMVAAGYQKSESRISVACVTFTQIGKIMTVTRYDLVDVFVQQRRFTGCWTD